MPADVELFDMLQPNVLEAMTVERLKAELERICRMHARVREYERAVVDVLKKRLAG